MKASFSLPQRCAWGAAAFALAVISGCFAVLLPSFYHDTLGLPARWVGLATMIFAVWNAVNDPMIGYLSDGTRSRWGRRMPYIRLGAPLLGLSFWLLWMTPLRLSPSAQFWWLLWATVLYAAAYTAVSLAQSALLPEVSLSEEGRAELQAWAAAFTLAGTLAGFLIPEWLRPRAAGDPLLPLRAGTAAMALVSAALILPMTWLFRERPELSRRPRLSPWKDIRWTFASVPFRALAAQNFTVIFVQALLAASIFYVSDYLFDGSVYGLLAALFGSVLLGLPLVNAVRRRVGLVEAQQMFLAGGGFGLWLVFFLPDRWIWVGLALGGLGLAGPLALTNVLFGEVADDDETRSGARREGAFFGANALLTKPAQALGIGLLTGALETAGFVPRAFQHADFVGQPEAALTALRAMIGPVPGTALILGSLLLFFYPLRRGTARASRPASR